jgi:hypothetical protein
VEVKWDDLRLAARTSGANYAEESVPVEEVLKNLSQPVKAGAQPAVVWFYTGEQPEENDELEAEIFSNEQVGLALRQFRRYRVNIDRITREDLRKEYSRTPGFRFFDPTGECVAKLEGKRAGSLKGFTRLVEKVWGHAYTVPLRTYTKQMAKILDRLDKLAQEKETLEAQRARLAEKPNPRKQREVDREAKEIEKEEQQIQEDEKAIFEQVKLRPEFLEDQEEKVAQKE